MLGHYLDHLEVGLRPHRLPAESGDYDDQRLRRRRGGAHPPAGRVLRPGGSRPAHAVGAEGRRDPQSGPVRLDDRIDHVRQADDAGPGCNHVGNKGSSKSEIHIIFMEIILPMVLVSDTI